MTTARLATADPATVKADAVVIGVARRGDDIVLVPGAQSIDSAFDGRLLDALRAAGATGKRDEVLRLATLGAVTAPVLLATGVGEAPAGDQPYDLEAVRRAIGAALRGADGLAEVATTLALTAGAATAAAVGATVEGALLGAYRFREYRAADGLRAAPTRVTVLTTTVPDKETKAVVRRAQVLCDAVALARDLVNTPARDLYPAALADTARTVAADGDLEVEVLDEKALRKGGYGGLLGVGAGSARPPRLIRLAYTHPRASKTVALVGKGITFDSGGLSLKPGVAMEWMKADMGGAAAVIATMQALAVLKPRANVVGYAPAAENMPSGEAIRPSDVLRMHNGTTVEVTNTDAEGRLILADAISRAGADNPDVIVDIATLTGAQLVALGSRTGGVMANDDALRDSVLHAAGRAGEALWPMPLPQELRASLDSPIADLSNLGEAAGGMLVAGLFLKEFVPAGTPWAHLDVAGPAYNQGAAYGYTPKGGTGAGVRTLVSLVEGIAAGEF